MSRRWSVRSTAPGASRSRVSTSAAPARTRTSTRSGRREQHAARGGRARLPHWTSESKRARSNGLRLSPSSTSRARHPAYATFAGVSWRRKRAPARVALQSSRAAPVRSCAGSCALLTVPIPSGYGPLATATNRKRCRSHGCSRRSYLRAGCCSISWCARACRSVGVVSCSKVAGLLWTRMVLRVWVASSSSRERRELGGLVAGGGAGAGFALGGG